MADIKIKIILEGGQFRGEAGKIGSAVGEVSAKVTTSFESMTSKVTAFSFAFNQISDLAGKVARYIAQPVEKFEQYESAMANVASLGVPNIEVLNSAVLDLAEETPVAIESLTGGLYDVVSAGVDAANQMTVLEVSARAAKAGIAETSDALNLGSAVIKAYGKDWSEMEGIMDQAFQTVKLGQTTFPALAQSMGQVAPLAATLKVSTQELFGAFSTLTGVTGDTSVVATQLRGIMAGLADPTAELKKLIEGVTGGTIEQALAQRGLAGVLKIVSEHTGGSASKMTELFGRIEAVNAALALSGAQYDTFIEKSGAMTESAGAMNEAFEKQSDTIESQAQLIQNQLDAAMISAVEKMEPLISGVLDLASYLLSVDWEPFIDGAIAAAAAVAGPVRPAAWPADGGGSSLELRDPRADNARAEAWAASREDIQSEWRSYSYRGVALDPRGSKMA